MRVEITAVGEQITQQQLRALGVLRLTLGEPRALGDRSDQVFFEMVQSLPWSTGDAMLHSHFTHRLTATDLAQVFTVAHAVATAHQQAHASARRSE
jgi:hypothetical protein